MTDRWLSIVGLGEDGPDGLSPAARAAIAQAELVVGGRRHLDLAAPEGAAALAWPSPLQDAFPDLIAMRGRPTVVLATGDPFFHGVGSLLAGIVDPEEMRVFPAPSAYSLACARLGWAGQDVVRLSLHGRALDRVLPHLHPGARILALSWDGSTPEKLAALLRRRGFGPTALTVLERMGGPAERVVRTRADGFTGGPFDPLNTVALEVVAERGVRPIPFTPGLPDEWFVSGGQITKREIRAITLSALAPTRDGLLWDVGAGSGSVGIEWMLADPSCRTIAVEARPDRVANILINAAELGVPDLRVVEGAAPEVLADLPAPDAVFLGGGSGDPGVIERAMEALTPGGRLVVNGVTLETQAQLVDLHCRQGGDLLQLQVARADRIGGYRGFRPARAIVQWVWVKP